MITANVCLAWEQWEGYAKRHPARQAIVHWDALNEPFRWTYAGLVETALKIADNFLRQGVRASDVCAIIMRHNKYFYPLYMGIAAIGAIPAVLAYPNARLHPDKFLHGLSGMAQHSGLDWILTERQLESLIKPLIINEQSSIKGMFFPLEWIESRRIDGQQAGDSNYELTKKSRSTIKSSAPFLLQHSSGTTGLQKAVVLSHQAVLEHIRRYSKAIKLSSSDKIANWLPLYHDMGLIAAFHMPLAFGIPSIQIDPFQWISAPIILFQAICAENATLVWLPNFAYNFMADRIKEEEMENIKLAGMRMFINCSEVVRFQSHEKFFKRFQKYGLKKEALAACYAMAETTFAVTQTEPGSSAKTFALDRHALTRKIAQPPLEGSAKKVYVSSGKPISGCFLKIVDADGAWLPEDCVGELVIKSVASFDGYRNNPEKTRQVLKDGWYFSGDLGFLHNGEYFIVGRRDDLIIVAGRNIFPEDIEDALSSVIGIIPGRVVAFGRENPESGTEDICVIAETLYDDEDAKNSLRLAIKQAGMSIDVTILAAYLVPPRWLIKSSSGKLSRKANKERLYQAMRLGLFHNSY